MGDALRLAELLCSRLCHDLAGPLAALIGILEIAHEEYPDSESVSIGEQTAIDLGQRLKLLRAAWGEASEELDAAGLQRHVEGLASSRNVTLDIAGLEPSAVFEAPIARLLLNILLLARESMPAGGVVALAGSPGNKLFVTISGPRAAWPPSLAAFLADSTAGEALERTDARGIQAPLTVLLAGVLGYRLSLLVPADPAQELPPPLLLART